MSIYQTIRSKIPGEKSYKNFETIIMDNHKQLSYNQVVGLKREWRAFYYLKERYAFWTFSISTLSDDTQGIDIWGTPLNKPDKPLSFQVGGKKIKSSSCDYYLQVTDEKIYLHKSK